MTTATLTKTKNNKGDVKMASPNRLKKLRIDAGYTIYSLGDKLGVNYSSVSYWENGDKFPRRKTLEALEDLFGVSYRELFTALTPEEIAELEQREIEKRKNK